MRIRCFLYEKYQYSGDLLCETTATSYESSVLEIQLPRNKTYFSHKRILVCGFSQKLMIIQGIVSEDYHKNWGFNHSN